MVEAAGNTVWDCYASKGDQAIREARFVEAEYCWFRALKIAEYFGEQDPRLCVSLEKVSYVYRITGREREAQRLSQRVASIKKQWPRQDWQVLPEPSVYSPSSVSNGATDVTAFRPGVVNA